MSVIVGTLQVDLIANTATFTGDLGKATGGLHDFEASAKSAGEGVDFSMTRAKGGLMLVEESIGVRLPRHLNTLIAEIPGVGAAFSAMLPLIGVIAAVTIIAKLIEHHEKLAEAAHKASIEAENLSIKEEDQSKSMELANLKLDDQIHKLEGGVKSNRLKEALIESSIAADKLAANFATNSEKIDLSIAKSMGFVARLTEGFRHMFDQDFSAPMAKGVQSVQYQLELVRLKMADVATAQQNLAEAKSQDEQIAALKKLQSTYAQVATFAKAAYDVTKRDTPENIELISALNQKFISTSAAVKDVGLQMDELNKKVKLSGKEDYADEMKARKEAIDELQQEAKKHIEYNKMMQKADWDYVKESVAAAAEEKKTINGIIQSKEKEVAEWIKINDKMIQEDKKHALVMADLQAKEHTLSVASENARFAAQKAALEKDRALIHSSGIQRLADEKLIDQKEEEEEQKHQNKLTELARKKVQERADLVKEFATKTLFENQSIDAALEQIGKHMLQVIVDQTLQGLLVKEDAAAKEKLMDAESSARSAFTSVMNHVPFPLDFVLAPLAAAAAFAGVMAFEQGGIVPNDSMAMVHKNEMILPSNLSTGLQSMIGRQGSTGFNSQPVHVTMNIQTPDANSFKASQTQIMSKMHQQISVAGRRHN